MGRQRTLGLDGKLNIGSEEKLQEAEVTDSIDGISPTHRGHVGQCKEPGPARLTWKPGSTLSGYVNLDKIPSFASLYFLD